MTTRQEVPSNSHNAPTQPPRQTINPPYSPLSVTPLAPSAQTPILPSSLENTSTDPHSAVFTSQPQLAHRTPANGSASTSGDGAAQDSNEERKDGSGSGSWKPKYGRTQSWDKQDWKRALQMSGVVGGEKEAGGLAGFSEGGRE
jgi:hypothetical protein